ncbi:uncharacterized protein LOC128339002 [Hemicordylus capensis]|uniref:uncharacterized protein LOC128339002 n=1 Tax=Hemicordylus capensis TaxID=884348 RepID=UPI0023031E22|nr:uncharacterized protein LOC128339002 [Hemicordylus capensis]XP_053138355.1 uncharacterized protein LOC128339002 [Hemicordylus capensis]XP_053138356.1 uncharacterized protein LOC128339002 [Hemicordylus capensis]
MTKVLTTIGLQAKPPTDTSLNPKGDLVFPRPQPRELPLPMPAYFSEAIKAEWAAPSVPKKPTSSATRFYTFQQEPSSLLQTPTTDTHISQLSSGSLVPRDGEGFLKDASDKKAEFSFRRVHDNSSLATRSSAVASMTARASLLWINDLLDQTPPEAVRLRQQLLKLQRAQALIADTSLDSIRYSSRASAASVVGRRYLWLKAWQADSASKNNLCALPYKGSKLFGNSALEKVLVESKDKKKTMPSAPRKPDKTSFRRGYQPFRSFRPSFGVETEISGAQEPPGPANASPAGTLLSATITHKENIRESLNSDKDPPCLGGRLSNFLPAWLHDIKDAWALDLIRSGYRIGLISSPRPRFLPTPRSRCATKHSEMSLAIRHLLLIGAIERVPKGQEGRGVYSILFTVPKKDGSRRAVLDLKHLNAYVKTRKFWMESLRSILESLQRGDLLASIDLKEAYLHVPIHQDSRHLLRFKYSGVDYQYKALPFGLASAPRTFTKILAPVLALLRLQGVHVFGYLDDLLLKSESPSEAARDLKQTLGALEQHGFLINTAKSHLSLSLQIRHLGVIINTLEGKIFLPEDRVHVIRSETKRILLSHRSPLLSLARLLGLMVSTLEAVPWASLHLRDLQWFLLRYQAYISRRRNIAIALPPQVQKSLLWWTRTQNLSVGKGFLEQPKLIVTTDASNRGWGAHCLQHSAQGRWDSHEQSHSINWLELRAIRLALLHFQPLVQGQDVLVKTDNTTAKAHVNRQGGTRSLSLFRESVLLLTWAETHLNSLAAHHVKGDLNSIADWLSREDLLPGEWSLNSSTFDQLVSRWGGPPSRPVCHPPQREGGDLHHQVSLLLSLGNGRSLLQVAPRAPLCLPANPSPGQSALTDKIYESGSHHGGSLLAQAPLVHRSDLHGNQQALAPRPEPGPSSSGSGSAPQSRLVSASRLETERSRLRAQGLPPKVTQTILASTKDSTNHIYQYTWRMFLRWLRRNKTPSHRASLHHLLHFLQDGLDKGLKPNTLKRQAASLLPMLRGAASSSVKDRALLKRFLRGATLLSPPVFHRFPSWNLNLVLRALQEPPFEPIRTIPLRLLSQKLAFLVALTSARRISELRALSIHKARCVFSEDSVRLIPDSFILPKVVSHFHTSQDVFLPSFCPHPEHPQEKLWHKLDVRRCLKRYIKRTAGFRKTDTMFVSFLPSSMGEAVPARTIARWIRACITLAYETRKVPPPPNIWAHSTRSAAASAAFASNASVLEICKAAVWKNPSTFIKHYKIDLHAAAQAAFGRALQGVLPQD